MKQGQFQLNIVRYLTDEGKLNKKQICQKLNQDYPHISFNTFYYDKNYARKDLNELIDEDKIKQKTQKYYITTEGMQWGIRLQNLRSFMLRYFEYRKKRHLSGVSDPDLYYCEAQNELVHLGIEIDDVRTVRRMEKLNDHEMNNIILTFRNLLHTMLFEQEFPQILDDREIQDEIAKKVEKLKINSNIS